MSRNKYHSHIVDCPKCRSDPNRICPDGYRLALDALAGEARATVKPAIKIEAKQEGVDDKMSPEEKHSRWVILIRGKESFVARTWKDATNLLENEFLRAVERLEDGTSAKVTVMRISMTDAEYDQLPELENDK